MPLDLCILQIPDPHPDGPTEIGVDPDGDVWQRWGQSGWDTTDKRSRLALRLMRGEVDRLTAELAAAKAGKAVEWTVVGRFFVATVGRYEMIVIPDNTLSIWPFKWQLSVTGTQDDEPCSVVLDSGPETGEPGKAACFAAYLRACGMGGK